MTKTPRTLTSSFLLAALTRRHSGKDALNGRLAKGEASATRLGTQTLQRGSGTAGVQPKVHFNKSGEAILSAVGERVQNQRIQLNGSGQGGVGLHEEAKC